MWLGFYRYEGVTPVNKESIIAIPADPTDRDDGAVSAAGLERGLVGRRIRKLRTRLGLSQAEFAERYAIPLANIRQYEIGRTLPPAAVRAYLRVIEAEPEHVAQLLQAA
jgi:putative transcriptional regulator